MKEKISLVWFAMGALGSGGTILYLFEHKQSAHGMERQTAALQSSMADEMLAPVDVTPHRRPEAHATAGAESQPRPGVPDLRERLLELRRDGVESSNEYAILLRELVIRGEPGVTAALELLADTGFDFPWRGQAFLAAFEGCDDERICPAIVGLLDTYRKEGLTFKPFRDGYYQLIARHGGSEGASFLWDLARRDASDSIALEALAEVQAPELVDQVLLDLGTLDEFSNPDLADALASWGAPRLTQRLTDLALDPSVPQRFRKSAAAGVARGASEDVAYALVAEYWTRGDPLEQSIVLSAVYGLGQNGSLSPTTRAKLAGPVLHAALRHPEASVRSAALSAVADHRCYWTPEMESIVDQMLQAGLADRETLQLLLGRMRYRGH